MEKNFLGGYARDLLETLRSTCSKGAEEGTTDAFKTGEQKASRRNSTHFPGWTPLLFLLSPFWTQASRAFKTSSSPRCPLMLREADSGVGCTIIALTSWLQGT